MSAPAVQAVKTPRDLRRAGRWLAAVLMPLGPAIVAVLQLLSPRGGPAIAAQLELVQALQPLGLLAGFILLPGAVAALRMARRIRPVLTAWATGFLVPGLLAMSMLALGDIAVVTLIARGWDPVEAYAFTDEMGATVPASFVLLFVFVVGHIVGTVLLGILAGLARLVPAVVAVLLAASQPLHVVSGVLGSPVLDCVAWGLTATGMAFLSLRLLRTPDDEWDLPPRAR